ncbi:MAG: transglycosylase SLT domain-containing protein [Firmicutes bacterium]|nr:transglycosylase SLT domain-containing protein [Bacillota bacterium]
MLSKQPKVTDIDKKQQQIIATSPVILSILAFLLCFSLCLLISNERKINALEERLADVETQLTQIAANLDLVYEVFIEAQKIKEHIQSRSRIDQEQVSEITYAILHNARRYNLNPYLLVAIAETESSFYRNAVGKVGEHGLIQVRYGTFKMMMKEEGDFNHWRDTLQAGARYLVYLLKRFNGNTILALAGYNAGPNRTLERLMEIGSPYVKKVENNYRRVAKNTFGPQYSYDLINAGWANV